MPVAANFDAAVAKAIEQGKTPSTYINPATINIKEATLQKQRAFKQVQLMRQQVKDAGPNAGQLRLDLLKSESAYRDALGYERRAKALLEQTKVVAAPVLGAGSPEPPALPRPTRIHSRRTKEGKMTQMNYFTYKKGQEMAACDYPFYVLLQALMRQAKADNLEKLCNAFPDVWKELQARNKAPGGLLPEEEIKP